MKILGILENMMLCRYRSVVVLGLTLAVAGVPVRSAPSAFSKSTELEKRTAKTSEDVDKYAIQLDKTERKRQSTASARPI